MKGKKNPKQGRERNKNRKKLQNEINRKQKFK